MIKNENFKYEEEGTGRGNTWMNSMKTLVRRRIDLEKMLSGKYLVTGKENLTGKVTKQF